MGSHLLYDSFLLNNSISHITSAEQNTSQKNANIFFSYYFTNKTGDLILRLISEMEVFQISTYIYLSKGVLPDNLRRGPYAVVEERCEETTLVLTF